MNKVVAIIVDGIASTDIFTSVCRLDPTEIVLFGNGVDVEDKYRSYRNLLGDACPDKVTYMQVESENKIPMDRVYRQILSYVHQTYLEGQLLIFYGSDKVINPDAFKVINKYGVIPHMNQFLYVRNLRYPDLLIYSTSSPQWHSVCHLIYLT